jgi:hypothetical protein
MPELDLGSWGDPWAQFKVEAQMLFPNDRRLQDQYLAITIARTLGEYPDIASDKKLSMLTTSLAPYGGLTAYIASPPSSDKVMQCADETRRRGRWVGEILLLIMQIEQDRQREGHNMVGSVQKAIHILLSVEAQIYNYLDSHNQYTHSEDRMKAIENSRRYFYS